MKKKILASIILFMILFTRYAYAETLIEIGTGGGNNEYPFYPINGSIKGGTYSNGTYSESRPSDLASLATMLDDSVHIDEKYNVKSLKIKSQDISIYDYDTTNEKVKSSTPVGISDSNKKYYYTYTNLNSGTRFAYCTFKLENTHEEQYTDIATILYKDAIEYNNNKYILKANIKMVTKIGNKPQEVRIRIGAKNESNGSEDNLSAFTDEFYPSVGATGGTANHMEIAIDWYILDSNNNEVPVNGLLAVTDMDLDQGFYLEDFVANKDNSFTTDVGESVTDTQTGEKTHVDGTGTIGVTIKDNKDTYIRSITQDDTSGKNVYFLVDNKSSFKTDFMFNQKQAYSNFYFTDGGVNRYKKITSSVVGGTITPSITGIKKGENKTIEYSPTDPNTQYLKSIKVDGADVELEPNKQKYDFTNITENHTINVEYGNKYKVTYDAKGGAPTPSTEYVLPNEKATQPATNPTKNGYTFGGWKKVNGTALYNYNDAVTQDIDLDTIWTPVVYHINYVLNGGTNDSRNPSTYTIEDTINFQPATRTGYDFLGWYEDANFNTKIDSISNRTGDITVYAKWKNNQQPDNPTTPDTPSKTQQYKIEHYKETENGIYELAVTDTLTGTVDEDVQAEPKNFVGYNEDKTNSQRVDSGKVKEDGSLTLKLYYNKNQYTVSFEPKNNTKIDSQTVEYQDKAEEPTKPTMLGYTFQYWYYINDENEEVRYNFDDPVTKDIDLIAKWEEQIVKEDNDTTSSTSSNTKSETEKKAAKNTPSSLPKTGFAISSIAILTVISVISLVFFGNKYKKLKIIK